MGEVSTDSMIVHTLTFQLSPLCFSFFSYRQISRFVIIDSGLYMLNLINAYLQFFVMMEQNRYNDRLKWQQLCRIRAGWNV